MNDRSNTSKTNKEWYRKTWGIVVAILLLPFFAIWYAWVKSNWSKNVKISVTAISVVFVIIALATSPDMETATQSSTNQQNQSQNTTTPKEQNNKEQSNPKPLKPKIYSGIGDDVITIQKPGGDGAAILKFECSACTSNTVVETNGAEALLVNTIGSYSGSHLIDIQDGSTTSKITITAVGAWKLTVSGLDKALKVTDKQSGKGDSVLHVAGNSSEAAITNTGESNFVVQVYPEYGGFSDLVVNTIGSYKGTVPLEAPAYVQITSSGSWTINVE